MTPPRKAPSVGVGFAVIGSELAGFTILGVGLDYVFKTAPVLVIVFTLLGFVAAALLMARLLKLDAAARKPAGPAE